MSAQVRIHALHLPDLPEEEAMDALPFQGRSLQITLVGTRGMPARYRRPVPCAEEAGWQPSVPVPCGTCSAEETTP
ncbi:hypothetical protein MN0502_23880 [Arthrobacter sp. MN05-02]|nr:hypothetical protein MN0502_23880 [Arthrobacter sp. MN05-02]